MHMLCRWTRPPTHGNLVNGLPLVVGAVGQSDPLPSGGVFLNGGGRQRLLGASYLGGPLIISLYVSIQPYSAKEL